MVKKAMIGAFILALFVIGVGYLARDYFIVDRCLDAGGKWNYTEGHCVGAPRSN
jgi:hypothetical protein